MDVIKILAWAALRECRYWYVRSLQSLAIFCAGIDSAVNNAAVKASRRFIAKYNVRNKKDGV